MIDSNNIEVMRDNLKELDQKIENLDVEIPPHTQSDAGKYLGVDESGDLEFSDPLPATTEAATGDVLGLVGENKTKGWITPFIPPAFSTTETDTGLIWHNGKKLYSIVLTGNLPVITETISQTITSAPLDAEVKEITGVLIRSTGNVTNIDHYTITYAPAGKVIIGSLTSSYSEAAYEIMLFYTKPAPTPEPENLTKKKKSK